MARRKINRPPPDPDDEPTRVYGGRGGCLFCRGWGFVRGLVVPTHLAVPCGCLAGRRLICAQPDGWPVSGLVAFRLARRLGMRPDA